MKKHELLEKAMRDYPKGTLARFKSAPTVDHISNGVFRFCDFNQDGKLHIVCGVGVNCFYSDGEWAVPVASSILSGKCAIQVNNEREFKLLMEHYEANGWVTFSNTKPKDVVYKLELNSLRYEDSFGVASIDFHKEDGYIIIPFSDFAAEVGITVPKFIMKSEDGVDLYEGDGYEAVSLLGKWEHVGKTKMNSGNIGYLMSNSHKAKAFSTKEAAELWIAEQNKPKSVTVQLYYGGSAEVNEDSLTIGSIKLSTGDLHDMLNALKSLQTKQP